VLELLDLPKERVLAVGDALRTDIAGAASVGIAACWVLGGIHGAELDGDPARIDAAARHAGLAPVACLPRFAW
jgi:ribonucleotide monophosphatase NagD (HAD superfamily)